jgi:transcription elongation GreA/GreB family factor
MTEQTERIHEKIADLKDAQDILALNAGYQLDEAERERWDRLQTKIDQLESRLSHTEAF